MIGNFNNTFVNREYFSSNLPKVLQDIIDTNLPTGLSYRYVGDDLFMVTGTEGETYNLKLKLKIPKKIKELKDIGIIINNNDIYEYMYNSQNALEVDSQYDIEINGEKMSINDIAKMPFSNLEIKDAKLFMIPEKIKENFSATLGDGTVKQIYEFEREINNDVFIKKYVSKDSALKMTLLVDRRNDNVNFKIDIDFCQGKNACDVCNSYHIANAIINNNLIINGQHVNITNNSNVSPIPQKIIDFWEKSRDVEREIGKEFILENGVRSNDLKNIMALYRSLIEKKPFKEYADCLYINSGVSDSQEIMEQLGEGDGFYLEYVEQIELSICGQKIDLFRLIGIFNAQLSSDQNECVEGRIKITSMTNEKLYRSFLYLNKFDEKQDSVLEGHFELLKDAKELEIIDCI